MADAPQVWYLAHPVAPDGEYSFEQNMAHALKIARMVWEIDYRVTLPWYAQCRFHSEDGEHGARHRAEGLVVDEYVAARLGKILLVGHRISSGMQKELDAVKAENGLVIDATGVPDRNLLEYLRTWGVTR